MLGKFAEIDLHPDHVSNLETGYLYEELIWSFSRLSNETAGEHSAPQEGIRLTANLLFIEHDDILSKPGAEATLYDRACGTGGMLSVAEEFVRSLNPQATVGVCGRELSFGVVRDLPVRQNGVMTPRAHHASPRRRAW